MAEARFCAPEPVVSEVHDDRHSPHRCTPSESVVSPVTVEQGTLVPGSKQAL